MKLKKVLPLVMATALIAATLPTTAFAAEAEDNKKIENSESQVEVEKPKEDAVEPEQKEEGQEDKKDKSDKSDKKEESVVTEEVKDSEKEDNSKEDEAKEEDSEKLKEEDIEQNMESDKVVTLGENLSEAQRNSMYEFFGTEAKDVRTIVVTHADEVKYMEGIATAEQIGASTNSCAYVEPTKSGGIKVKTANLNFVTSAMIASTLTTAGMENCNVIAACPFEVSGTGALTGIIMAYETASGDTLDAGKKEAAMEELITVGDLAESIGQEEATDIVNEIKTEVIDKGLTDPDEIVDAVDQIAKKHEVSLSEEDKAQISALMEKISQFDYDLGSLKETLDHLNEKVGGLQNVWNSVKSFFVGSGDGILSDVNMDALGGDVITDSTVSASKYKDGLLTRIINFFTGK